MIYFDTAHSVQYNMLIIKNQQFPHLDILTSLGFQLYMLEVLLPEGCSQPPKQVGGKIKHFLCILCIAYGWFLII
jgi:hypothetical protein